MPGAMWPCLLCSWLQNLPMKINWDYMDHNLLENFWKSNRQRATIRSMLPDCMSVRAAMPDTRPALSALHCCPLLKALLG